MTAAIESVMVGNHVPRLFDWFEQGTAVLAGIRVPFPELGVFLALAGNRADQPSGYQDFEQHLSQSGVSMPG
jgi:hypothetical protein